MGLTGSDLAYKPARFGLMRFGASRFNYFTYNLVVAINGTDRTAYVAWEAVSITQALNDEPDSARIRLVPTSVFTPTVGQTVTIGLGCRTNYEFAGQIVRVTRSFEHGFAGDVAFLDLECIDYGRLIDRRLVLGEYSGQSATDIAVDILANYTSGFTAQAVATGLPTIDNFPITNEPVQSALRRLANLIDGGFYVDAYRDVHLFGSGGDSAANAGTNPLQLTETLSTLKSFAYTSDVTQVRTRVIVEGRSTSCPIGSPGSTDSATVVSVDYLLVAGGGGSAGVTGPTGGGGGGGALEGSANVSTGAYAIVVGAGGPADASGSNTTGFSLTATGGGLGHINFGEGVAGGCGGGGSGKDNVAYGGGAGTAGQGYAGGAGGWWFSDTFEVFFEVSGGGGGAGGVGGSAEQDTALGRPGNGGPGRLSSISGTPTYYGGGGAGGSASGLATGTGGAGGGGNTNANGTANLGGGAGGTTGATGFAGGSGVVIVRYRTGDLSATGGTITTSGVYTIHTFTSNGTFTVTTVSVTTPPTAITDFPLADASQIEDAAGTVRIGNHAYSYTGVLGPQLDPGENPPGSSLTADAAAGASSLTVASGSATFTESTGWVKVDEQYVRFTATGATTLTIPATGYGALAAPAKSGAAVTWIGALQIASTTFDPPFPSGTVVVQRVTVDDATAQSTVAGIEGGDGIHEHIITDDRLSLTGAQGRGAADLNTFSTSTGIVEAEWVTQDVNARPGRQQAVSFDDLTDTLLITRVEITVPVPGVRPFRHCLASSLKQPGLYDVVLTQRT